MAIESINSMMSLQAQRIQTPVNTTEKTAAEYTDVTLAENTPKVDKSTNVVENIDTEDKSNSYSEQREPSREQLNQAVSKISREMSNSELTFGIHDETNRITIKIVDKDTKEVIKELPPEKTLDLIAKAWELAGILVDEKR